jgi:hypothetical protein
MAEPMALPTALVKPLRLRLFQLRPLYQAGW